MTLFALRNPVAVLVLAAILFISGLTSFLGMRRESFPEIKVPYIFVTTVYPGANPAEIEDLVTNKIEDKLEGLDGVEKMTSTSLEGVSNIFLEFAPSVKVETALQRVRDKVDQSRRDLPTDAEEPVTQELNFSSIPVITISLFSDYGIERLENLTENLREKMSRIPGVLEAKVTGKQEKEIAIDADPDLLQQYDITLDDLVKAVQTQHRNIPGGTMKASGYRFSLRVTGELTDPDQFKNLIVRSGPSQLVRIKDVADVAFKYSRDRQTISRTNGKPSLTLTVAKRTGEDIIGIVDEVKSILSTDRMRWPAGTHYEITYDMSSSIRHMVNELQNHLLMGIMLVLLVLSFFLGVRNSVFISTAIPFSMALGFMVLSYMNVTLNMVVLFSLVLALGMLVDDGIVVVENIYRHLNMGKDRFHAALDGTREVMVPVFTATLTTVCAFAPVLFMPGIFGDFLKYLPITVGITLIGSLFVAFVFNPVFASLTMKPAESHGASAATGQWFEHFKNAYRRTLQFTLGHPLMLLTACILFVISGILAYSMFGPGVVFFPIIEPEVGSVEVEGPLSIDIAITDSVLHIPERAVLSLPPGTASVKSINAIAGSGKSETFTGQQSESNKGYLDILFREFDERRISSNVTITRLADSLPQKVPGWKMRVIRQQEGPPTGKPVELEVSGDNYAVLSGLSEKIKDFLGRTPGLANIGDDYDPARPELRIDVDREQAKRLGFSVVDVASAVRGAIYGTDAVKYRVGSDEYKVMVRLSPEVRENLEGFDRIILSGDYGKAPLTSMAVISRGTSIASVNHTDGKRTIQVWAELAPGQRDESRPKAMTADFIDKLDVPQGYTVRPGSGNRTQNEAQDFLVKAFFLASGLIFLIMVFQFNSLFQPFLILLGITLSIGGVFWGLIIINLIYSFVNIITGGASRLPAVTFSILMTGVGITALAGVVAKNGIVLIDFMNRRKREGHPLREAVIEGGAVRLRPVLLTAITAMIGLLPMATGVGFDFLHLGIVLRSETTMWWAPLAWAIFFGLLFNTALVLIATPTFYYAWENRKENRRPMIKDPVNI